MPLPKETIPSYETDSIRVKYSITAGLQFKKRQNVVFERKVHILPAFNSQIDQDLQHIPLPFRYVSFTKPINHFKETAFNRIVSPERGRVNSVWDRCYLHGTLPKLTDFKKYPRHPLNDHLPSDESPPSQASMFNVVALESQPSIFTFRSNEDTLARIKLGKTILRLGEELTCLVNFTSSGWTVFQLSASIIFTETISPKYTRSGNPYVSRQVFRRHEEACWMSRASSFSLSLPSDSNPTMFSDLFTASWSIDFVLICNQAQESLPKDRSPGSHLSKVSPTGPGNTILEFSVPIQVVPSLAVLLSLSRISNPETHSSGNVQIVPL